MVGNGSAELVSRRSSSSRPLASGELRSIAKSGSSFSSSGAVSLMNADHACSSPSRSSSVLMMSGSVLITVDRPSGNDAPVVMVPWT